MIILFGIIEQINYKNMKKKDLIIDKLYIHSNDRKAYYRGEDDNYGSIFELVDNIGCHNLTSSFPHLKSIASNTYWRHSSLHEKFNEIENLNLMKIQISDKELLEKAKRDYPIGTEYYPAHLCILYLRRIAQRLRGSYRDKQSLCQCYMADRCKSS